MRIKVYLIIYSISIWVTPFLFSENIKYFRKYSIDSRFCNIELKYPIEKSIYNKINCYELKYDDKNRIESITFLEHGKPAIDNMGITKLAIDYNDSLENRFYYDKQGKPTLNYDGIHSYCLKKNKNNHALELINYDKNGKITKDKNEIFIYKFTLDKEDRIVKVNFFNASSDSVVDKKGCFFKTYQWKEDKTIYFFETSYYGKTNSLILNARGYAISQSKYDKTNNELIEQSFYDTNKKPKVSKQFNVAKISSKYDLDGNEIERKYYGTDGKLTISNQGYSIIRQKYNTFGKATEQRLFGNDDNLICGSNRAFIRNGFAIVKCEYDDNGNNTKVSYYENEEKLVQDTSKIAIRIYTYDENNRKTSELLYDANNKLVLKENGCITNWKYDKFDNIVEEQHFGQDNKLKESKKGIAIIRWIYDVEGKLKTTQYFNSTEKLLSEN